MAFYDKLVTNYTDYPIILGKDILYKTHILNVEGGDCYETKN